ncbi:MAG: hypothetical protein HS111_01405 [Kofleriaceae bacterium]|nr:hypothetical protein [Kofleriaceae bacterium]
MVGLGTYVWVPGRDLAWSRGVFRPSAVDPQVPVTADVYSATSTPRTGRGW